jgi:hypothetical protein
MTMTAFLNIVLYSLAEADPTFQIHTSIIRGMALMMEVVSTSETSVNIYETTRLDIPEENQLHACRRGNLKSQQILVS